MHTPLASDLATDQQRGLALTGAMRLTLRGRLLADAVVRRLLED